MPHLNRASRLDQRAFDAVAAARLPGLAHLLPRLSKIADHSVLWGGFAVGLTMTRQPRMRRAALRGTIAIGLASPMANIAGKQAFRRHRPLIELIDPSARSSRPRLRTAARSSLPVPHRSARRRGPLAVARPVVRRAAVRAAGGPAGTAAWVLRATVRGSRRASRRSLTGRALRRAARTGTPLPAIRSPWRLPTSPSFPSGHSASAAAFATAVALEAPPAVSVPIAVTAGAVAFSRVYTGAHYPGDVLAGLALGTAAGLGTRLIWPTRPAPARAIRSMPAEAVPGVSADGAGVVVVVNNGAGSSDAVRMLPGELPAAEIVEAGEDIDNALREAAERAAVLGVCGGDGTVRAAARVAVERNLPLLVLPGGTLNHFARAVGIETVADALAAYRTGCVARVDVARAGAEIFLNTASFGAYTDLVRLRERLENRMGKWPAMAVAAVRVLRHAEPADVYVDGHRARIWFAFIGNCRYGSRGVAPTWRTRLDDGLLDVRFIGARKHMSRSGAVAALLIGHLRLVPGYMRRSVHTLDLAGASRSLRLTCDGEVCEEAGARKISKDRAALAVFIPAECGDGRSR